MRTKYLCTSFAFFLSIMVHLFLTIRTSINNIFWHWRNCRGLSFSNTSRLTSKMLTVWIITFLKKSSFDWIYDEIYPIVAVITMNIFTISLGTSNFKSICSILVKWSYFSNSTISTSDQLIYKLFKISIFGR
jgi:hypothetical protein